MNLIYIFDFYYIKIVVKNEVYWLNICSCIPVIIHIETTENISDIAPDFVKSSVGLVVVSEYWLMGSVAERGVCTELAVANLK